MTISILDLQSIINQQLAAQQEYYGSSPDMLHGSQRGAYVMTMATALSDEMSEVLQEIHWKPWASNIDKFNRDRFQEEMIDVLHFWINLWLLASRDAEDVYRVFELKANVNADRRARDYTGDDKCSECGR